MPDQLIPHSFANMDLPEKRRYLHVLSDVVWDIEAELAQAKAERAALMCSLRSDRTPHP